MVPATMHVGLASFLFSNKTKAHMWLKWKNKLRYKGEGTRRFRNTVPKDTWPQSYNDHEKNKKRSKYEVGNRTTQTNVRFTTQQNE